MKSFYLIAFDPLAKVIFVINGSFLVKISKRFLEPLTSALGLSFGYFVQKISSLIIKNYFRKEAFLFALCSVFLTGCYTVPETGRSSLSLVSNQHVCSLSEQAFEEIQKEERVCKDKAMNARVKKVGDRVVIAASQTAQLPPVSDWQFVVFDDDKTINAFALPGGKVGVYTGLLKLTQNDAQLAAVMAHEVGHVVAQHGAERMSQNILVSVAVVTASVGAAVTQNSPEAAGAVAAGGGALAAVGFTLPFSRLHENEADYLGLIYMARAGYDPREAVKFWQLMTEQDKAKVPEFLSTHPSDSTRIERLEAAMPQALIIYEESQMKNSENTVAVKNLNAVKCV
jgi:metalloendopeptidase OMA1, mitochondrial